MATTQPNVSRIEKGGEMELSTLRTYVEALGGRLEVTAVFDDERFPVTVGGMSRSRGRRLPTGNRGRTGRVGGAASVPQ